MNIKKHPYVRLFLLVVLVLAGIDFAFIAFDTVTRTETTGPLTTITIPDSANNIINNSLDMTCMKTIKISNGFSPLKRDSYNVLAVSVFHEGTWMSFLPSSHKWLVTIDIVGFGVTRSDYSLIRANGQKKVVFGLDFGPVTDFRYDGFYPYVTNDNYSAFYSRFLNATANSSGIVPVPAFSLKAIKESVDHETVLPYSDQDTQPGDMDYYPISRWSYIDPLAGDSNDAIFVGEVRVEIAPGKNVEMNISSTFTGGLLDSSRNDIRLTFNLPPDPDTLTPEQLKRYNISIDDREGSSQYNLDYINVTVE